MKDNECDLSQVNLYVGIDWASESHYYVADAPSGERLREGYFPNSAEGFDALLETLDELRGGGDVAVIYEATRGAIHYALLGLAWLRLCPVNPIKTKKLNELDGSAKGKSDPRDATLLCGYLRQKARSLLLNHVEEDSLTLRLREAVNLEAELVCRTTKLKQRIGKEINGLCPQLNTLLGDLEKRVYRRYLLERSPLEPSPAQEIESFLRSNHIHRQDCIERFLEVHASLRCLGRDRDLQLEQLENIRSMVEILEATVEQLRRCERRIDALYSQAPQVAIYRSMPNVGPRIGPRLASLFGSQPGESYACKAQALAYFGQSPLTLQTGSKNNKRVRKRMNCQRRARHTIYLWARVSNLNDSSHWPRSYLDKCKERGDGLPTRYRKLGGKLVSILYRCLVDNIQYDPSIYMKNLHKKA